MEYMLNNDGSVNPERAETIRREVEAEKLNIHFDKSTTAFLLALRNNEGVDISRWVCGAVRMRAGLKPIGE